MKAVTSWLGGFQWYQKIKYKEKRAGRSVRVKTTGCKKSSADKEVVGGGAGQVKYRRQPTEIWVCTDFHHLGPEFVCVRVFLFYLTTLRCYRLNYSSFMFCDELLSPLWRIGHGVMSLKWGSLLHSKNLVERLRLSLQGSPLMKFCYFW